MTTEPDANLIAQAKQGKTGAFEALVKRYRLGVIRFAFLMIGDSDEAESVGQEALSRAYTQLDEFDLSLPFRPWLHGIALNLCRNHLRDRTRHAKIVAPDELSKAAAPEGRRQGVLSAILRREINDATQKCIAELPEALREVFLLHYVESLEYDEIARITGVPAGTLRVRAHRARNLLQCSLGPVVDTWLREGHRPADQD